jgi:hypothetical protein
MGRPALILEVGGARAARMASAALVQADRCLINPGWLAASGAPSTGS